MKEIIAIIRPKKMGPTKAALEDQGFPCFTASSAIGRGKQRGIASEVSCELPNELQGQGRTRGTKYVPKRLVNIMVRDEDVDTVVQTIIRVNCTEQIGDGQIFVCPLEDAVRIRTKETGDTAIV